MWALFISVDRLCERWRVATGKSHKELAFEQGYASAADWSKAQRGERPCDVNRIARMSVADQEAFCRAWLQELGSRDLLEDLCLKVDRLLAVMGPKRQAKAALNVARRECA